MSYATNLKRAVGTGSSRAGTQHHWQMILSSIALVFVVPFFVITFGLALGRDHAAAQEYLSDPFVAIVLAVSLIVGIRHFMFEALEAIEDYVHGLPGKLAMFGTTAISYLMIAVTLFSLARIAF